MAPNNLRVVEVFLPLRYGDGQPIPSSIFELIKEELTEEFGGVTSHSRVPAKGLWTDDGDVERDTIIIIEVMMDQLDKGWWKGFRQRLELLLRQKEILIRASQVTKL